MTISPCEIVARAPKTPGKRKHRHSLPSFWTRKVRRFHHGSVVKCKCGSMFRLHYGRWIGTLDPRTTQEKSNEK